MKAMTIAAENFAAVASYMATPGSSPKHMQLMYELMALLCQKPSAAFDKKFSAFPFAKLPVEIPVRMLLSANRPELLARLPVDWTQEIVYSVPLLPVEKKPELSLWLAGHRNHPASLATWYLLSPDTFHHFSSGAGIPEDGYVNDVGKKARFADFQVACMKALPHDALNANTLLVAPHLTVEDHKAFDVTLSCASPIAHMWLDQMQWSSTRDVQRTLVALAAGFSSVTKGLAFGASPQRLDDWAALANTVVEKLAATPHWGNMDISTPLQFASHTVPLAVILARVCTQQQEMDRPPSKARAKNAAIHAPRVTLSAPVYSAVSNLLGTGLAKLPLHAQKKIVDETINDALEHHHRGTHATSAVSVWRALLVNGPKEMVEHAKPWMCGNPYPSTHPLGGRDSLLFLLPHHPMFNEILDHAQVQTIVERFFASFTDKTLENTPALCARLKLWGPADMKEEFEQLQKEAETGAAKMDNGEITSSERANAIKALVLALANHQPDRRTTASRRM